FNHWLQLQPPALKYALLFFSGVLEYLFPVWPGDLITVFLDGEQHVFDVPDPLAGAADEAADADRLLAPMPGLIKVVNVAAGETVKKGAAVIVMEAMKMEYTLNAPRDGVVGEIAASAGDQVDEDSVLLVMADG
ncbi:MAG: hypothetical protein KKB37_00085, partial [Alphaproteobacteria bacterium]|nr:hypothetical protein [Alphaproteobacteria bacterium]